MKINEIYLNGSRWYRVEHGQYSEDLPSVNTILTTTESAENKKRLANWKHKQAQKFFNANRTCLNCLHLKSEITSKTLSLVHRECGAGEKLRSPLTKKHRCKSFVLNAEMEAAKSQHGSKARDRGSKVHEHIQDWFLQGILPTPKLCKYSSQIVHLLKNLKDGKLLVEEPVFSKEHGYCGRVDFCGEYLDQVVVADWVTTDRNYLQRENFERKFLQCAGYALAIAEMKLTIPTEIIVVAMTPDRAELYREPLDKWTELWLKRVEQFWEMQPLDDEANF
ncbi:MAG: hypothetical protein [Caudoviricetes sp.]|nr:MAG: hypothetical protein [Caudoviricetes sp.]